MFQALSVIGGTEAEKNTHPWMAALGSRERDGSYYWFCGGSYIGRYFKAVMGNPSCLKQCEVVGLSATRL